jgi:hypothetical protein
MIIYDLQCDNEHRFEGWFRSAVDFDNQLSRHLIACPQCESRNVRRVPSAVAISEHRTTATHDVSKGVSATMMNAMPSGTQIMAAYKHLVQTMIAHSEDVGDAFASEARKIHYNEEPDRAIRGTPSSDEIKSLTEEGISLIHLPVFKEEDLN